MPEQDFRKIVVVGASAGGVESLIQLARGLPQQFGAPVLIVLHIASDTQSRLPQILSRCGPLEASLARDGERLSAGRIYIAPPGNHLMVEQGQVTVTRGPSENRFRPSVDVLFRSAALAYGPAVIGVVLSGTLDDGSAGLHAVARRGGIAVVQHPDDALFADMPRNALDWVQTAQVRPVAEMGPLLGELVAQPVTGEPEMDEEEFQALQTEVRVARGDVSLEAILKLGRPSHFSCPDCQGNLLEIRDGRGVRYRCHIGHAYSASTLLASLKESAGKNLGRAVRALEETSLLLHELGEEYSASGQSANAERSLDRAHDTERYSQVLRDLWQKLED